MENLATDITSEKAFVVGSFGFKVEFKCGTHFEAEPEPILVFKKNRLGIVHTREVEVIDPDLGIVQYTVREEDLPSSGTYSFQIIQEAEDYCYKSPIFTIVVFPSI